METGANVEDINDKFFAFLNKSKVVEKAKQVKSNFEIKEIDKHKTNRMKKPVETICKTLKFDSASEASRHFGYFQQAVSVAIKKGCKCAGYYWRYVNKNELQN